MKGGLANASLPVKNRNRGGSSRKPMDRKVACDARSVARGAADFRARLRGAPAVTDTRALGAEKTTGPGSASLGRLVVRGMRRQTPPPAHNESRRGNLIPVRCRIVSIQDEAGSLAPERNAVAVENRVYFGTTVAVNPASDSLTPKAR